MGGGGNVVVVVVATVDVETAAGDVVVVAVDLPLLGGAEALPDEHAPRVIPPTRAMGPTNRNRRIRPFLPEATVSIHRVDASRNEGRLKTGPRHSSVTGKKLLDLFRDLNTKLTVSLHGGTRVLIDGSPLFRIEVEGRG